MKFVDHKLAIRTVFPGDIFGWSLLCGKFVEVIDSLFFFQQVFLKLFVSADQDDDPLLNNVRVKRVLLIMGKCFNNLLESLQS